MIPWPRSAIALAVALAPGLAPAGELPKAVKEYQEAVTFVQIMCDLRMIGARQAVERGQEIPESESPSTCVREGTEKIKSSYEKAAASTRKASAKAALKEHFIAASSAVRGVLPGIDERVITYRARTDSERRRADEAWERVKLEF